MKGETAAVGFLCDLGLWARVGEATPFFASVWDASEQRPGNRQAQELRYVLKNEKGGRGCGFSTYTLVQAQARIRTNADEHQVLLFHINILLNTDNDPWRKELLSSFPSHR